jgi:hypothetical protein
LVFDGWFSQIKKRILPSAETVGLNSGSGVLILVPRFSILMIVSAVMIFSFWGFKAPRVSLSGWPNRSGKRNDRNSMQTEFFKRMDLASACKIEIYKAFTRGVLPVPFPIFHADEAVGY